MQTYSPAIQDLLTRITRKMHDDPKFCEMMYDGYGTLRFEFDEPTPNHLVKVARTQEVLLNVWEKQTDEEIMADYGHLAPLEVKIDPPRLPATRYQRNLARRAVDDRLSAHTEIQSDEHWPEPLSATQRRILIAVRGLWYSIRTQADFHDEWTCKQLTKILRQKEGYAASVLAIISDPDLQKRLKVANFVGSNFGHLRQYVHWQISEAHRQDAIAKLGPNFENIQQ